MQTNITGMMRPVDILNWLCQTPQTSSPSFVMPFINAKKIERTA
jgi:hypothetical protein